MKKQQGTQLGKTNEVVYGILVNWGKVKSAKIEVAKTILR